MKKILCTIICLIVCGLSSSMDQPSKAPNGSNCGEHWVDGGRPPFRRESSDLKIKITPRAQSQETLKRSKRFNSGSSDNVFKTKEQ